MKKKNVSIILIGFVLLIAAACGDSSKDKKAEKPTLEELKKAITHMHDSILDLQKSNKKVESLHRIELINRLLAVYRNYPENDFSAECLDKVHMLYAAMEAPEYSAAYADTILEKFPKYKNRALILESQGANYDVFITPRDSSKVRKYYSMLLKEFPNLDKEKKDGIIKRLKSNNLTFDEYVQTLDVGIQ